MDSDDAQELRDMLDDVLRSMQAVTAEQTATFRDVVATLRHSTACISLMMRRLDAIEARLGVRPEPPAS